MIQMAGDDARYLRGRKPRSAPEGRVASVVDLFSGCGGLVLGIQEAARQLGRRLDIRIASELDATTAAVYAANVGVPPTRMAGDVGTLFDRPSGSSLSLDERRTRKRVGPDVDLLIGGPPCQGYSPLNNHTRGDDPKNELYLTMLRATEVLEPSALLIENVPALEKNRGRYFERVVDRLLLLGYGVDARVVSVADVGVPQVRKRHVLVAHRGAAPSLDVAVDAARIETPRTLRWAIGDLKENGTMFDGAGVLSPENRRRAEYLLKHRLYDLPNRLRPNCQRGPHKYKSMYGRLRWDEPAQTVTSGFGSPGQGRYLHPKKLRTLTPHEAARLQFFPDWFDFSLFVHRTHLARAIGNAVPPKLGFVVASHLLSIGSTARQYIQEATSGARVVEQLGFWR